MSRSKVYSTLVFVGLVCGGLLVATQCSRKTEPTYGGKPLKVWLKGYDLGVGTAKAKASDAAIRAMGPAVLPFVLPDLLHRRDPAWKLWANGVLIKVHASGLCFDCADAHFYRAVAAFSALRDLETTVPALIAAYDLAKKTPPFWTQQCIVLAGFAELGPSCGSRGTEFLLGEVTQTNDQVRSSVFRALAFAHSKAELVVPVLVRGLQDPDLRVRHWAAVGLGEFGTDASSAVPALNRFLGEIQQVLKSRRWDIDYRTAEGAVKHAIRRIKEAGSPLQFTPNDSKTGGNSAPTGARTRKPDPANYAKELQVPLAYRSVAVDSMISEANYCASQLCLPMLLPLREEQVCRSYVAPPRLMQFVGAVDTTNFSFGFGKSGRLRFITRLDPFGQAPLSVLQRRLAGVPACLTKRQAYDLATTWLAGISVDVASLQKRYSNQVQQHFFFDAANGGAATGRTEKTLLPIFDVIWGDARRPAVLITLYGPTRELLQLRQTDESFSSRPVQRVENLQGLLDITDDE